MSSRRRTYLNSLLSEMKYVGKFINKSTNIGVNTLVPAYELNECSGVILIFYADTYYIESGICDYCIINAILDGGEVTYRVPVGAYSDRLAFSKHDDNYTNVFKFSKSTGLTCQSQYVSGDGNSVNTTIKYLEVIGI